MNTFGVYQTYYETQHPPLASPSRLSWIGSTQASLLLVVGAATGPIYDAGYFHELLICGSFLVVFGHMMLSLCTVYYQALLAQAICIGIGTGMLFVPSVAILSTYFNTKLAFAMGVAASGSSLGTQPDSRKYRHWSNSYFRRWRDLPNCSLQAHPANRFPMGSSDTRIHYARNFHHPKYGDESARTTCEEATTCGPFGLQATLLHALRNRRCRWLPRPLRAFLLRTILRNPATYHQRESWILSTLNPQQRQCVWPYYSELPCR